MPIKKGGNGALPRDEAHSKTCPHCKRRRHDINDFLAYPEATELGGREAWCKHCRRSIKTKEELIQYCYENHREFPEQTWSEKIREAEAAIVETDTYKLATPARRIEQLEEYALLKTEFWRKALNYANHRHVDHTLEYATYEDYKAGKKIASVEETKDVLKREYDAQFNGQFTETELRYLREYYDDLSTDFVLSTASHKDYARKLAKASLALDNAQDAYARGEVEYSTVKECLSAFDLLSKSANFAPATKKTAESGLGSFGEICYWLETNGYPMTKEVTWEQDDVDKTIEEFLHLAAAIGVEGA